MATQIRLRGASARPPLIRYFEYLQFAALAIQPFIWLAFSPNQFLLFLLSAGPMQAALLALALAVSRGRQAWAKWVLLGLYILAFAGIVSILFTPPFAVVLMMLPPAILRGISLALLFTKQASSWLHQDKGRLLVSRTVATASAQRDDKRLTLVDKLQISPGLFWILASGTGGAFGAWLAWITFPSARFATNVMGHFSWALVGFASTVGIVFGIAQAAAISLLKPAADEWRARTAIMPLLWIPATAAGVFAMIFPLWWTYAEDLLLAPGYLVAVMLPGIILLSLLQWGILYFYLPVVGWRWRTIVGAAVGVSIGLLVAMMLGAFLPLPMEVIWAGAFGLILGAIQNKPAREMSSRSRTSAAVN